MRFTTCKPVLPLSNFVDHLWLYEGYEAKHNIERILPTGTIEMVVNLREDEIRIYNPEDSNDCQRFSGTVVSGAYGRGFASDTDEEAFIIGIHFKPGGAFPFLGPPLGELTDKHVELETLWGRSAIRLRETLCEAKTCGERFRLLQESLLANLSSRKEHHYSVAASLGKFRQTQTFDPVREVVRCTGLSQRRFIQVFKAEVGMTPKLFSRIQRFQRTRGFIESSESINWVNAALAFGYFDQSHLIREFIEFSGRSPMNYLRQRKSLLEQGIHIKSNHLPCV